MDWYNFFNFPSEIIQCGLQVMLVIHFPFFVFIFLLFLSGCKSLTFELVIVLKRNGDEKMGRCMVVF